MIVFTGDSWALKAYTEQNFEEANQGKLKTDDIRLCDFWDIEYQLITFPGKGNLHGLELLKDIDSNTPIVWVYTEPGRDYYRITQDSEFNWIQREDIFELRQILHEQTFEKIRQQLPNNPLAMIGGLSDVPTKIACDYDINVIHYSWQKWISEQVQDSFFKFGWGASDIGWRMHSDNVKPSKAALFAWDEQIKEWCYWEDNDYFCHEHPSIKANKEFGMVTKPIVKEWIKTC